MRANRIEAAIGVASNTKGNTMSNDSNTKAHPTHRIYSVTKNGDSKTNWQEIGAAWPHKDGKGFNLKFNRPSARRSRDCPPGRDGQEGSRIVGLRRSAALAKPGEGGVTAGKSRSVSVILISI
jgi:hypothetical protein